MNEKVAQSLINVKTALLRLKEALEVESTNSLIIDGTVQRFEFSIELFWKMLRRVLLEQGVETGTPREAIVKAFELNIIDNQELWLQMLRDRNQTSHTYDEGLAEEIFGRIPDYYEVMRDAVTVIEQRWLGAL